MSRLTVDVQARRNKRSIDERNDVTKKAREIFNSPGSYDHIQYRDQYIPPWMPVLRALPSLILLPCYPSVGYPRATSRRVIDGHQKLRR